MTAVKNAFGQRHQRDDSSILDPAYQPSLHLDGVMDRAIQCLHPHDIIVRMLRLVRKRPSGYLESVLKPVVLAMFNRLGTN
jgi:hypothetical protein